MHTSVAPVDHCGISSISDIRTESISFTFSPERRLEFDGLLDHLLPRFRRMALRWLRNPDDAEDAVQDAMLSALRHLDQFDGRSQMSTWLTAILRNAVLMQIRRRPRGQMPLFGADSENGPPSPVETLADPRPTPDQVLENRQLRYLIRRLRNTLPRHQQAVLNLRTQADFSIRDVAKALNIPEGTVKAQLARGRANLRERLHALIGTPRQAKLRSLAKTNCKPSSSTRRNDCERDIELSAVLALPDRAGHELWAGA